MDTWAIEGTLKTTACARGRCESGEAFVQDFLVVQSDGTFAFGIIPDPSCPSAMPVMGSWKQKASSRVRLKGENLRDWWATASARSSSGIRIKGRRFRGRFDPDAGTLVVRQLAHATVQGIFVSIRIRWDMLATRVDASTFGAFTALARGDTSRSWVEALQLP